MKQLISGILILGSCGLIVLMGCNKSDRGCLTNTGPIIFEERDVSEFDSLNVADYVNIILKQDTVDKVVVEAGKNIIGGITTEIVGRQLFIGNTNKCNWLRDYSKPINVHISIKNLLKIHYNASGNITTEDTLRSTSLTVEVWGGCGTIDLLLHIPEGYFALLLGTATMHLRGYCAIASVYSRDYGLIQASELGSGYNYVKNSGSNDCYVSARQFLDATVESIGNIYYAGNPDSLFVHIKGTGEVIPL